MKTVICAIALLSCNAAMADDVYVHGYMRHDGAYVQPYHRSSPDHSLYNNYGSRGQFNPYTGMAGHENPMPAPQPFNPYGWR